MAPRVTSAEITSPIHAIKSFKGVHKKEKRSGDVEALCFEFCNVERFPRGLNKHFPNLRYLAIRKCALKETSRSDLKGLSSLEWLSIQFCMLTSLPDNLFRKMPKLEAVGFPYNKIEFASSKLLQPLIGRDIIRFSLRGNKNIDARYWPNLPDSLTSLEELMQMIDENCKKHPLLTSRIFINPEIVIPEIKALYMSERFSDFKIIADERQFKVHKSFLGMQSPKFAEIFDNQSEATEMKIHGFSPSAVEALLLFVYTCEVKVDGNLMEKFLIAEKFKIPRMKTAYDEILSDQLNAINARDILDLADRYSSEVLKKKAGKFIDEAHF